MGVATTAPAGPVSLDAALEALGRLTGIVLPPALLEPLEETVGFWARAAGRRRASLGPAGVLLSVRHRGDIPVAVRLDTEPAWQLEDPLLVHRTLDRLAAAAGLTDRLGALRAPLRWGAWPPPGTGPGPYLGVSRGRDGGISVRSWGPATGPHRSLGDLLRDAGFAPGDADGLPAALARRLRLLLTGVEVAAAGPVKLGIYLQARRPDGAAVVLGLARRLGAPAADLDGMAGLAAAAGPDAYAGLALRRGPAVAAWEPVVELGTRGCPPGALAAWLASTGRAAAAETAGALEGAGLLVSTLAVGAGTVACYAAPGCAPEVSGRGVAVASRLGSAVGEPDPAGGLAQSIIDWRGAVHTVSWSSRGGPPRWRTIGPAPGPGREA